MSRRGRESSAFSLFAFQDIITSVMGIMVLITLILALELLQRTENSPSQKTQEAVSMIRSTVSEASKLNKRIADLNDELAKRRTRISKFADFDVNRIDEKSVEMNLFNERLDSEIFAMVDVIKETTRREQEAKKLLSKQENDPEKTRALQEEIKKKMETVKELRRSKRIIFNPTEGDTKTPWLVEITAQGFKVAKSAVSAKTQSFSNVTDFENWANQRDRNSVYFVLLIKPDGILNYFAARRELIKSRFDIGYDLLMQDQTAVGPETGAATE